MSMTELPPLIRDVSAWVGPDFENRADWIELLSSAELAEIEAASRRLAAAEIDWQGLETDDFPLPTLKPRLERIRQEILEGRGFVLLRGLPVELWGRRLSAVAFLGLGRHLGNLRSQNRNG